ncbi:Uncharacterized conserved protein [Pseudomonas sp. ok272]|uniref:DUF1254 domain-containing protein n=1 Tax=unclassified Pseudomonas TaxID=196821 RepID=UPI0008C9295A|nr:MULTISPECIES: DUF1254 domain-containing protein [unclassified Pseudomonas]SEN59043.1 Uncharacterized conserved protein [Pseudomonas sp. ok272]SFN37400.1 Uncharacterized conserved protein [Pseudomonas sp. ok602]
MNIPFSRRRLLGGLSVCGAALACPSWLLAASQVNSTAPDAFRALTAQAWIYAYPMLMHYQTMEKQVLDPAAAEYVGGFNRFRHYSELYTPQNREIVTPNNDTPYSWAWLDLRSEPQVLSVPAVGEDRYYVHQLVDQYTHNFAYVGVLSTGREAGDYLIAGPGWQGETPAGIKAVLRSETEIVMVLGRTGLNGPDDMPAVRALQQQYRLQALHTYAGTPAPVAAPVIAWQAWDAKTGLGPGFIRQLNQILTLCPTHPTEQALRAQFMQIGIVPGQGFDLAALSAEQRQALMAGIQDAQLQMKTEGAKVRSTLGLFGTREAMHNNYLNRALAASLGIYGNSVQEAFYTGSQRDNQGQPLVGGQRYRLRFAPGQLPPASEFWSLTLYDLPDRQLVANGIDRYCLSSRDRLQTDADGGLALWVQSTAPDHGQSNWLPAPASGAFTLILRLYGPQAQVIDQRWMMPGVEVVPA